MIGSFIKIVACILGIVGFTYILPVSVALVYHETQVVWSFSVPMIASLVFAAASLLIWRNQKIRFNTKTSFVIVAVAWLAVNLFGAIPLYVSGAIPALVDAVFESFSGFTTTGGTIVTDVEALPRSINLWRCQTHWLGGMGIVALTVALLPLLGVGGFQLIKAETTGPEKGKLTPKIATTAKVLWFMYISLTVLQTILLRVAGMDFVDALSHAFATLGTGGFSTRNSSVGTYDSLAIDIIVTVFMFLGGINFSMYYYAFTGKGSEIKENSELRNYLAIVFISVLAITLLELKNYGGFFNSLRYSSFQTISIMTTTGFSTDDYLNWTSASQVIIFLLFFIGGCSGSTAGGVKVIRWVILAKQFHNEIQKMLHPQGIFTIRINKRAGRKDVVFNVAAFLFIYVIMIAALTLFACIFKLDILSSFTGALSMVGNVGPAFGKLGPSCNYAFLPAAVKWAYCFAMLAGRLEFFTIVIFLSPSFWKK
ncbi:MAG: TrkH family potassium uptake protein [Treponema sp.]|nr:TrkH family potassium uptake protein [Treponema sp.]